MRRLLVGVVVVAVAAGAYLAGPAPAQAATVNVTLTCDGSRLSAVASPGDLITVTISAACDPYAGLGVLDAVLQDAPGPGNDMLVRSTAPTGTTRDAMWVIPQTGQNLPAQAKQVLDLNVVGGASSAPTPSAPAVTPSSPPSASVSRKCQEPKTDQIWYGLTGTKLRIVRFPWFKGTMVPGSKLQACSGDWKPQGTTHLYSWYRVNPDGTGRKKVGGFDQMTYVVKPQDKCIQLIITASHNGYYDTPTPSAVRCRD